VYCAGKTRVVSDTICIGKRGVTGKMEEHDQLSFPGVVCNGLVI